jgi:membrane-associated phospholipid phosphatase
MIRKRLWFFRVMVVIGCGWVSGVLSITGLTIAAPRGQQSEPQSSSNNEPTARRSKKKTEIVTEHVDDSSDQDATPGSRSGVRGLGKDFLEDQKRIWTSPARLRLSDADWLIPASGFAAGLFVTDRDVSTHLSHNPSTISHYNSLSTAGIGALVGGAAGLWVLSYPSHNEHWRETGLLAGEAAINSFVAVEAMKYSLRRQRPFQGDGSGPFFQGGTSFPSEHAAAAWSVAGVIAHEYPGLVPRIVAYGLASLVSYSRIKGRQHFPSDVFIGGMIGQFIAQDVYSRHHNPELGGSQWRSIGQIVRGDGNLSAANQGSPYVPLDSWIYPAFDRLAALGIIDSSFAGMRPWTRLECARLINEAADRIYDDPDQTSDTATLIQALQREFAYESESLGGGNNRRIRVESVYTRLTGISGPPLNDAYHFGETLINDYGRPYAEGFSNVTGFSASASSGRLSVYVRGEYQHAPFSPELPLTARQFILSVDNIPSLPPARIVPVVNRVRLLDAYASMNIENWQLSFGKQSLWWGPTKGGPLMFSDNANPVNMFRVSRVSPFKLPSILGWLGPVRLELFLGQLEGHQFIFQVDTGIVGTFGRSLSRQPFLQGEKLSFKPTPNFEFGLSLTAVFAGGPTPLTGYTLTKSYSIGNGNGQPGSKSDPGDRRSGIDFTYRIPALRLSYYAEAFVEDEFSPIAYWNKAAIYSGIYLPRVPGIPKLDLRIEGGYTDLPSDVYHPSNNVFYTNNRYPNGYTNQGNLLGSWMGRQSQSAQAWTKYSFTPRNSVEFGYRHQKVSQAFLPGGGTLTDGSVKFDYLVRPDMSIAGNMQYEKWNFPVLASGAKSNVVASVQFTFWPNSKN